VTLAVGIDDEPGRMNAEVDDLPAKDLGVKPNEMVSKADALGVVL